MHARLSQWSMERRIRADQANEQIFPGQGRFVALACRFTGARKDGRHIEGKRVMAEQRAADRGEFTARFDQHLRGPTFLIFNEGQEHVNGVQRGVAGLLAGGTQGPFDGGTQVVDHAQYLTAPAGTIDTPHPPRTATPLQSTKSHSTGRVAWPGRPIRSFRPALLVRPR